MKKFFQDWLQSIRYVKLNKAKIVNQKSKYKLIHSSECLNNTSLLE